MTPLPSRSYRMNSRAYVSLRRASSPSLSSTSSSSSSSSSSSDSEQFILSGFISKVLGGKQSLSVDSCFCLCGFISTNSISTSISGSTIPASFEQLHSNRPQIEQHVLPSPPVITISP